MARHYIHINSNGKTVEARIEKIGSYVFKDPKTGKLHTTRYQYMSAYNRTLAKAEHGELIGVWVKDEHIIRWGRE